MNRRVTSYALWLGCLVGAAGLHRLYNGKIVSGLLWLCTLGFLGVGQLVDLFLIPDMVEDHNFKHRLRRMMLLSEQGVPLTHPEIAQVIPSSNFSQSRGAREVMRPSIATLPTREQLMIQLLHAAQAKGGKLSVTQGVMATQVGFSEVESVLKEMVQTGYVGVTNDRETGVVLYDFREL